MIVEEHVGEEVVAKRGEVLSAVVVVVFDDLWATLCDVSLLLPLSLPHSLLGREGMRWSGRNDSRQPPSGYRLRLRLDQSFMSFAYLCVW